LTKSLTPVCFSRGGITQSYGPSKITLESESLYDELPDLLNPQLIFDELVKNPI